MAAVKSRRRLLPLRRGAGSLIMSAMTWLLKPAVVLMNRLRYPQKFVLISLLFAIPMGLMMGVWLMDLHGRMA